MDNITVKFAKNRFFICLNNALES